MIIKKKVSIAVVRRLPRYYRYLSDLLKMDITRISSKELSSRMGITASQIRQDEIASEVLDNKATAIMLNLYIMKLVLS